MINYKQKEIKTSVIFSNIKLYTLKVKSRLDMLKVALDSVLNKNGTKGEMG